MLEVEEATMLVALVSKSKVNAGDVLSGCPHQVSHDGGDLKGQVPIRFLRHICDPDLSSLLSLGGTTHISGFRPDLPRLLKLIIIIILYIDFQYLDFKNIISRA